MEKNIPMKIHIVGSVGSGKTTLARTLSSKLNVPFYELDNVVWKRLKSGDRRRSDKDRDEYLNKIVNCDAWIIEGVHHRWVFQSFLNADLVIFLDTGYSKRTFRIIRRFILQKLGFEKANYKPTLKMFRKMFIWNTNFENESKPEILKILTQYNDKVIVLEDNIEVEKYFIE
jgi:adenylate kinase family enzyme